MTAPVSRERIAELLRGGDPLAAARAAALDPRARVAVTRDRPAEDRLLDGDREGTIAAHRAAHAAGRPSEAAVAYGAGHTPDAVAARIADLAALARDTGLLRAVCPIPADKRDPAPSGTETAGPTPAACSA